MRVCRLVTQELLNDMLKGKDGKNLLGKCLFKGAQEIKRQQALLRLQKEKKEIDLRSLSPAARDAAGVADLTQQTKRRQAAGVATGPKAPKGKKGPKKST
eukprot:gene14224-2248_t